MALFTNASSLSLAISDPVNPYIQRKSAGISCLQGVSGIAARRFSH